MELDTIFVLYQEKNKWLVKEKGKPTVVFDECNEKGYICESSDRYLGTFVRRDNDQFSVFLMWDTDSYINDSDIQYILYAGKCSTSP